MAIESRIREVGRAPKGKIRRRLSSRAEVKGARRWSLLSPHGRVVFYIAVCPDSSVLEIARNLGLTERAVWGVVRALRQRDIIRLRKRGRRHHYAVNLDAPLLHPTIRGITLRPILRGIARPAKQQGDDICD